MRHLLRWLVLLACGFYLAVAASLLYLRFLPPLIPPVQIQRQIEATAEGADLARRYDFVGLGRMSDHLEHAVVAAEDARFYQHNGFDWTEVRAARRDAQRRGRPLRGASTLTQQLVKNLFLTTHRNPVRKALEWSITPLAEGILGKRRILELYLERGGMGQGGVRRRSCRATLLRHLCCQPVSRPSRTARGAAPRPPHTHAGAYGQLQRYHQGTYAADGVVALFSG